MVVHVVSEVVLAFDVSLVFVVCVLGGGGSVSVNEAVIMGPEYVGWKDANVVLSLGLPVGKVTVKLAVTSDWGSFLSVSVAGNVCRDWLPSVSVPSSDRMDRKMLSAEATDEADEADKADEAD